MCLYIWQKFQTGKSILQNCDIPSILKKQIYKYSCIDESEFHITSGTWCHHQKSVLNAYLAGAHVVHGSKLRPICLPHWWMWQNVIELKASQSFHSGLMEQKSWDVVAITFYLHRALGTVQININRWRMAFFNHAFLVCRKLSSYPSY